MKLDSHLIRPFRSYLTSLSALVRAFSWRDALSTSVGYDLYFLSHMSREEQASFTRIAIYTHISALTLALGMSLLLFLAFYSWLISLMACLFVHLLLINLHRLINADASFFVGLDPNKVTDHYHLAHLHYLQASKKLKEGRSKRTQREALDDQPEQSETLTQIETFRSHIEQHTYVPYEPKVSLHRVSLTSCVVFILFSLILSQPLVVSLISPLVTDEIRVLSDQSYELFKSSDLYESFNPAYVHKLFYKPKLSAYFHLAWRSHPLLSFFLTSVVIFIGLLPLYFKSTWRAFPLTKYSYILYLFERQYIKSDYQNTQELLHELLGHYKSPLRDLIEHPWSDPPFNQRLKPINEDFGTFADFLADHEGVHHTSE